MKWLLNDDETGNFFELNNEGEGEFDVKSKKNSVSWTLSDINVKNTYWAHIRLINTKGLSGELTEDYIEEKVQKVVDLRCKYFK